MAKKSKTQRAKASANRQAKKARAAEEQVVVAEEAPKKKRFFGSKKEKGPELLDYQKEKKATSGRSDAKQPNFLQQVRSEMRRVTWPSRRDVLQWSGVVVAALIFFGLFCYVLDDFVVTPLLFAISSLGA